MTVKKYHIAQSGKSSGKYVPCVAEKNCRIGGEHIEIDMGDVESVLSIGDKDTLDNQLDALDNNTPIRHKFTVDKGNEKYFYEPETLEIVKAMEENLLGYEIQAILLVDNGKDTQVEADTNTLGANVESLVVNSLRTSGLDKNLKKKVTWNESGNSFPDIKVNQGKDSERYIEIKAHSHTNKLGCDLAKVEEYMNDVLADPKKIYADYIACTYEYNANTGKAVITKVEVKKIWEYAGRRAGKDSHRLSTSHKSGKALRPTSTDRTFTNPEDFLKAFVETVKHHHGNEERFKDKIPLYEKFIKDGHYKKFEKKNV